MTSSPTTYIEMGVLGKPKGLKGEIRIRLHNPESSYFKKDKPVWLGRDQQTQWHVAKCVPYQKHHLIAFQEASRLEDVQNLVLQPLFVPRDALDGLDEGQYYHIDLIDCEAVDINGQPLGQVKEIIVTGANDVMVIALPDGQEMDVPLMEPWVREVDLKARKVTIEPMDVLSSLPPKERD